MVLADFLFENLSSKKCSKLILGATSYYHPRNVLGPVAASTTTTCMHALSTSGGLSGRLPGNRYSRAQRKIPLAEKSPGISIVEELLAVRDNWCSGWEFACYPTVAQSYILNLHSKNDHKIELRR